MLTGWVRAAARLWWLKTYNDAGLVPTPRDIPSIRSWEPDAARVLLVGNGAAGGWQVSTYGLALAGRLAEAVQRCTGRGCDVDQVGDEVMNVASAGAWLGTRSLVDYDVVVLVLGLSDALRQTRVEVWATELGALLDRILAGTRPDVRVVVTGIEPISMTRVFRGPLARLGQRHADRLNAETGRLAADRPRVEVVGLPVPDAPSALESAAAVYESWAATLAPSVTTALAARPRDAREALPALPAQPSATSPAPEWAGMRALLDSAKSEFRADVAWISLLDGGRYTLPVASIGNSPAEVPLDLTFCVQTMQQDGTFVVPDRSRDPRFKDNPFLDVVHFEYYAGHRLRSADGDTIGTFCVASIRPRRPSRSNPDFLRDYAQRAEQELGRALPADQPGEAVVPA